MKLPLFGIAVLFAGPVFSEEPKIQWEVVSPYPGAQPLHSVSFGRETFVAAGDGGIYYQQTKASPGTLRPKQPLLT